MSYHVSREKMMLACRTLGIPPAESKKLRDFDFQMAGSLSSLLESAARALVYFPPQSIDDDEKARALVDLAKNVARVNSTADRLIGYASVAYEIVMADDA